MILVVCAPSSASSSSSSALRANDILPSGGRRPRRYPSWSSRTTTRRATTTTKTKTKSEDDDDDHDDDEGENNRIDEKRRFHWSEKLKRGRRRREKSTTTEGESEDNTRDELRMMPKDYFRCSEKRNNAQVNMQEVHRDRDTSILVTDAQLEREFRDENDDRALTGTVTFFAKQREFVGEQRRTRGRLTFPSWTRTRFLSIVDDAQTLPNVRRGRNGHQKSQSVFKI